MAAKPIQSVNDLDEQLSLDYDPLNLNIYKVFDNYKAVLVFEDKKLIFNFEVIEGLFKRIKTS